MDIRDVTEPVPFITDGQVLTKIFDLQKELLEGYIKIETLPQYPISTHTKPAQILIKDFVGRITEEFAEAHESYKAMVDLWNQGKHEEIEAHLQNFNEELADALHFFVELMVYVGLEANEIMGYYRKRTQDENLFDALYFEQSQFKTMLSYARMENTTDELCLEMVMPNTLAYTYPVEDGPHRKFLQGGRRLSPDIDITIGLYLWGITFHLNIARNFLKNKPWKQSQMITDTQRFQESLMKAWLQMIKFFDAVGLDEDAILTIYFKKNCINKFRQKSNY